MEADIRDQNALQKAFAGSQYDCIVHLAARAGVRPSLLEPQLYVETNINGTMNLLELARNTGVKQFVFGSSSSVYGQSQRRLPRMIHLQSISLCGDKRRQLICHSYAHFYGMRILA